MTITFLPQRADFKYLKILCKINLCVSQGACISRLTTLTALALLGKVWREWAKYISFPTNLWYLSLSIGIPFVPSPNWVSTSLQAGISLSSSKFRIHFLSRSITSIKCVWATTSKISCVVGSQRKVALIFEAIELSSHDIRLASSLIQLEKKGSEIAGYFVSHIKHPSFLFPVIYSFTN